MYFHASLTWAWILSKISIRGKLYIVLRVVVREQGNLWRNWLMKFLVLAGVGHGSNFWWSTHLNNHRHHPPGSAVLVLGLVWICKLSENVAQSWAKWMQITCSAFPCTYLMSSINKPKDHKPQSPSTQVKLTAFCQRLEDLWLPTNRLQDCSNMN